MHDHEEIRRLLDDVRQEVCAAMADGKRPTAALVRGFDRLRERLEVHMRWEEEDLFPSIERRDPAFADGPGRALRADHEALRRFLGFAAKHVHSTATAGLARVAELLGQLLDVLRQHDRTESRFLARS